MAFVSSPTDYTDKDLASLRARLYRLVVTVFPEWTDQNVATFGNTLLESFAYVGDVLAYYQDNQAAESRFLSATQRRSLLSHAKLIAFKVPGATAATVDVRLAIDAVTAGDVTFPAGTFVATADAVDPVRFQLLDNTTIPAGATQVVATVENSESAEDAFTSSGLPNQEFVLTSTPYLDDSAVVVAADGAYAQVDNFLQSTGLDRHFVVLVDQRDRARLRFGNGISGSVPVGSVSVVYKTGGGAAGEVPLGAVQVLEGAFFDAFGAPVQASVVSLAKAVGGTDRMSNEAIKVRGPASVTAPVNTVTRADFETNALRLSSVARALMLTSDEDPAIPENSGNLYVIGRDGAPPSTLLRAQVKTQVTLTYPSPLTFTVNVLDPLFKTVNVEARVFLRPGFTPAVARAAITAALTAWFAVLNPDGSPNTRVDFGAKYVSDDGTLDPRLPWSDLFNAVRDVPAVAKMDPGAVGFLLNGGRADVLLAFHEFPVLGTVTLVDARTGQAF